MRAPTHLIAAACALAVPPLLFLDFLGDSATSETGWSILERIDVIATVFCVIAAALLVLGPRPRRMAFAAAAALLFAAFGLLIALPVELPAQFEGEVDSKLGGYLTPVAALAGAGAALLAAERAPRD